MSSGIVQFCSFNYSELFVLLNVWVRPIHILLNIWAMDKIQCIEFFDLNLSW